MKSTKLALLTVLLCGALFACKKEEPAAAVEAIPAPMVSEPAPMVSEPAPMAAPAPVSAMDGTVPVDDSMDEDSPHSGGDKVGTGGAPVPEG